MHSVEILETPDKSENDKKLYRVIRLENGLKALLISDPKQKTAAITSAVESDSSDNTVSEQTNDEEKVTKLAACCLCVDVGSSSDPREIQGLAHFLEHMVFLGSEKYPNEDEFDEIMQKSGGRSNAETRLDETFFHFDTRLEFLDDALDCFSQFFKAPLMLKAAMTREREAVESEFALHKNDRGVRLERLLSSVIGSPLHPSSAFTCGNLETLKNNIADDVLYQKLHDFRKRHYSANRMYLCLQSSQHLDDLQEMANRHFSTIPNNHLAGDDFSQFNHLNAFQSKFYEKVYFVESIDNISQIDITWCLEPMIQHFKCNPDIYISQILGHEGEGSLLSYLRKKLWAVNLYATPETTKLYSLFKIYVHLTEDGFDHLDDVLQAIFSYLKLLQMSGPNERIFRELQTMAFNSFRFQNEDPAFDNVASQAIKLKQYPLKNILTGDTLYFEYNANVIQKIIDELNSRKFNIMVTTSRKYSENIAYELTEKWCGTMYSEIDMPEKWFLLWKNATPFPEFALPGPNTFIADDFTISYEEKHQISKYPTKILDNNLCELWFRQDDTFLLPTACYNFYFMIPNATSTIENTIQMTLLSMLLKHQFVEKLYPATLAGLEYNCNYIGMGLCLKVSGFNQKLHLIVDVFCKCLKSLADDITEKQFKVFVEQFIDDSEIDLLDTELLRSNVIKSHIHPVYKKNQRIRSLKFAEFQQFCRKYGDQMRIKALMQGNLTEDHALNIMHNVLNELKYGKVEDLSLFELRTAKLPVGVNYLRCKAFDRKDVNTEITNFYQIGPISHRTQVMIDLLAQIASEPLFDTLRTKEQLSYDVTFNLKNDNGILGYSITVFSQESKFSVDYVDERIEHFRTELITIIETIPNDDFDAIKASLSKTKMSQDNELNEEVRRNWYEITSAEYVFDRRHKEVEHLSTITKSQLLEFYRTYHDNEERKLSVQVIGNVQNNANEVDTDLVENYDSEKFNNLNYVNLIQNLLQFKQSLDIYPIAKTNSPLV
ncbi:nardilysin-like [Contarinia nasturtii]|uniref:nardilysin-like n=1 Tax=Contarinia nasturtii TaxID=265458 RepID=UPI0012D42476|nr:nardilysin-like [Contarinia nasturtii]